ASLCGGRCAWRGVAGCGRAEVRCGADEPTLRGREHSCKEGVREGIPENEERRLRGVRGARRRVALVAWATRRNYLAHRILSINVPEVARTDSATKSSASGVRRPRL